jgi:hypothetical protein
MLRFYVTNTVEGTYWCCGNWCEEPEWFDANEAKEIAERLGRDAAVGSREFDASDCE